MKINNKNEIIQNKKVHLFSTKLRTVCFNECVVGTELGLYPNVVQILTKCIKNVNKCLLKLHYFELVHIDKKYVANHCLFGQNVILSDQK